MFFDLWPWFLKKLYHNFFWRPNYFESTNIAESNDIWHIRIVFMTIKFWNDVSSHRAINSCWEKCDEKCVYMFNVYKNQLSRLTGSRNLMRPKTLPTIWYTYMTLVTKYQISAINSYWEKCDEKYLGRTDRDKTVYTPPPSGSGGIIR